MSCYEPTPHTELMLTGTKGSLPPLPRPTISLNVGVKFDHEYKDALTNTGTTLNPKLFLNGDMRVQSC